ncbi:MAG: hypothetical protein IVW57_07840, partial [Ktedonobacterales bacterium]|nr:hypothetical protein [Ktedonobacterales bacterium]
CIPTPLIYDVANDLASAAAYHAQMKRWFVFPRQHLLPALTRGERLALLAGSAGTYAPSLLGALAALTRRRGAVIALATCLGLHAAIYSFCEVRWLGRRTPLRRWPLVPVVALVTPVHILWALLTGNEVEWRGQRLRIVREGAFEVPR